MSSSNTDGKNDQQKYSDSITSNITTDTRKLRACMICGMVRSLDQFQEEGCLNCESFLQMRSSLDRVLESTSSSFSGLIGVSKIEGSWVAKCQRLDRGSNKVPGLYAVRVFGTLGDELMDLLVGKRIRPVVVPFSINHEGGGPQKSSDGGLLQR